MGNLNDGAESTTTYEYDPVGNRTGMTIDGVETRYYYNGLNQLETAVTGDTQVNYSYDGRGNQIKEETTIVGGEEGSEVTTVTKTVETEYALTGEMTSLIKIENDVETLEQTNLYNHNGQRIVRTEGETTRSYYYDNGIVAFTEDGSSVSSANVLSEDGAAIGTYRSSTYHSYLKDMQGSTTSIIKEDGTLSASYDYTDFGETTELTGNGFDNQICYTGGIYDEETGLYYLNARYYDPEIGRFISQDSYRGELNDPGQWHLYAYCANNPINYVDPSGHKLLSVSKSGNRYTIKYRIPWNSISYGLTAYSTYTYWASVIAGCVPVPAIRESAITVFMATSFVATFMSAVIDTHLKNHDILTKFAFDYKKKSKKMKRKIRGKKTTITYKWYKIYKVSIKVDLYD